MSQTLQSWSDDVTPTAGHVRHSLSADAGCRRLCGHRRLSKHSVRPGPAVTPRSLEWSS